MATVILTITDGPSGVVVTCESKNPEIPMTDGQPDLERFTPAQSIAVGALMEVGKIVGDENFDFRTLLRD